MLANLKAWYAKPFDTGMSASDWALFLGLVVVIMIGWRIILAHIIAGVE